MTGRSGVYSLLNAGKDGVSCSIVRFETRGKELLSAARLRKRSRSESESSATALYRAAWCDRYKQTWGDAAREVGVKAPESLAIDPKPLDLVLSRLKPSQRGVED